MFQDKTISWQIAGHLAVRGRVPLPDATLHAARRALLDAYGVMLAGTGLSEEVAPYRRHAQAGQGPARLIGSDARTSVSLAALANGALAHALDYGDTFDAGPAHPHTALVPALLALADDRPGTTLGDVLGALALGGDFACRLSIAAPRPYEAGGWYPPPLVNLIAGAAASGVLLGFGADAIRHAMGLAMLQGAFPGEIKHDPASPIRGVREGFAARGAVEAAMLAGAGATCFTAPLEGRAGFFAVYGGGAATDALTTGLGAVFLGEQLSFKPWPACRGTHPYIEAALRMRGGIALDAIDRIEAETGPIQEMLIRPQAAKAAPTRAIEAKFSIPFTVAAALVDGAVGLDTFAAGRLADPALRRVAARVVEVRNPAWGRAQAASGSLTVRMRDGRSIVEAVPQAAGHPERPMRDDHLIAKFVDCARFAATPWNTDRARRVAGRVMAGAGTLPIAQIFD